jgi:hypothetical protein
MDSLNDALIEAVKAAGGSANVGAKLWPEKPPQHAQRALLDCLNEDRPAKLSPEQVLLILRLAKARGHHGAIGFILQDLSYSPTAPIEPKDEAAELQKQFIAATQAMQELSRRMESLTARPALRAAA